MRAIILAVVMGLCATTALAADIPGAWERAWPDTDFSKISVDPAEVFSGGPPKDGIPAITGPTMIPIAEETGIPGREPVMSIALDGHPARAYPVRYLMWHEIVNDRIGTGDDAIPIAVTFCPLCTSGLIFDLRLPSIGGHMELELGVSGMLRHSDMIMYDRQTESWWQQFTGEAIAGVMTGAELTPLPALLESWDAFRAAHPDGLVMAEPTGFARPYGQNPYRNYDKGVPFLYKGAPPPHQVHPLARVVRVGDRAWPLARVREAGRLEEDGVVIQWTAGQASALEAEVIAEGREVGNVTVTDPEGNALVHEVVFAFAFHAFTPDGTWMLGEI